MDRQDAGTCVDVRDDGKYLQRNECSAVGLPMARYFWQAHQYSWPIDCWRRISIPTIDQLRR